MVSSGWVWLLFPPASASFYSLGSFISFTQPKKESLTVPGAPVALGSSSRSTFITAIKSPWASMLCGSFLSFLSSQCFVLAHPALLLPFGSLLSFWIRDLVRETAKKCSLVPLGVFLFFALFVLSEAILFVSIFFSIFIAIINLTFRK